MLDISRSRPAESHSFEVASTVTQIEEGVPLVYVMESGKQKVQPATGTSDGAFAGIAVGRHVRPTVGVMVEALVVPASGTYAVTLARTPRGAAADRGVFNAAGDALVSGTIDGVTKYTLSGKTLTVHSGLAGTTIKVQYTYDLTATEAMLIFGGDLASGMDFGSLPYIGGVNTGVVYVSNYNPAINWAEVDSDTPITLGAGMFTTGGSNTATDAVVESAPTSGDPFLGIRLHP